MFDVAMKDANANDDITSFPMMSQTNIGRPMVWIADVAADCTRTRNLLTKFQDMAMTSSQCAEKAPPQAHVDGMVASATQMLSSGHRRIYIPGIPNGVIHDVLRSHPPN